MGKVCEFVRVFTKSLLRDEKYRSEEDIEQQRGNQIFFTKLLCPLERFLAYAITIPHASSQPIAHLADYFDNLQWYY